MLVAVVGGFILAAASLLWADDKSAADKRADELLLEMKLQTLLKERVATAELGVQANQHAYDSGTVTLDQLIQSRKDLAEARYAVATTAAEREAALQEIVDGSRQVEAKIKALYKTASRGGEANQLAMATIARQTAEIRLLEEQLRNAKGK
jgi:hypothetical protein